MNRKCMFRWALCFFIFFVGFANDVKGKEIYRNEMYTYERLLSDIGKLTDKYGDILTVREIGQSHFRKKIPAVKLGTGDENILFIGSHHGREWITTNLLMKMLENYADAYQKGTKIGKYHSRIFHEVSIWFVPMLNPDGVTVQQGLFSEIPKRHHKKIVMMNEGCLQFTRWKANGVGIDLNRQYPTGWNELNKEPTSPHYQFYRGKKPLMAREVKHIVSFTHKIKPRIAVAYHSSGREIYWEYKNGKNKDRDWKIAHKIALLTNYELTWPDENAIGGGYTDWFIQTFKQPAFTLELSHYVGETNPPLSIFEEEWIRNKLVGVMLAHEAKQLFKEHE